MRNLSRQFSAVNNTKEKDIFEHNEAADKTHVFKHILLDKFFIAELPKFNE